MGGIKNLEGNRYGKLVVHGMADRSSKGLVRWNCICDCGKTKVITAGNLNKPNGTKSCGCLNAEVQLRINKPTDIFTGAIFATRNFGQVEVLEYRNFNEILIRFEDGTTKVVAAKELRSGALKNNFAPCVCGVGFMGEGDYPTQQYIDGKKSNTPAYEVWRGVLRRCYDAVWQEKHTTYIGCSVVEEWHNFQNFAEWYYKHKHYGKGYDLDKDLTVLGNKIYSPEFCDLIPPAVNGFYTGTSSAKRGVHFCNTKGLFIVQCHVDGRQNYYGNFSDDSAARAKYSEIKLEQAEKLLKKYGENLSPQVSTNLVKKLQDN